MTQASESGILPQWTTKEAIVVAPRQACEMLCLGRTRLYELLQIGELESYNDGRARRITVAPIHAYVKRKAAFGYSNSRQR